MRALHDIQIACIECQGPESDQDDFILFLEIGNLSERGISTQVSASKIWAICYSLLIVP